MIGRIGAGIAILLSVLTFTSTVHAIEIRKVVSDKGIVAWFVPDQSVPLITINFVFRGQARQPIPMAKKGWPK